VHRNAPECPILSRKVGNFLRGYSPFPKPSLIGGYKPPPQNPIYPVSTMKLSSVSTPQNMVSVSTASAVPEIWLPPMQLWLDTCLVAILKMLFQFETVYIGYLCEKDLYYTATSNTLYCRILLQFVTETFVNSCCCR